MFFSIIIPVYSVERWLAQCLDSVLSQDFTDYEIIIIDDCSPDESYKIYETYAKKHDYIRVIKHEVNKKLGGARNTGIRAAQGEWILFLDSDDLMAQGALSFYHEKALITQDGYFSGICDRIDENGDVLHSAYYESEFSDLYDKGTKAKLSDIFITFTPVLWCKCYKKTFLLNNKFFFNENVFYEDIVFNARLLLIQPNFICYNMVCVYYRENLSSITQNAVGVNQIQRVDDWFKESDVFHDLILKNTHYCHMGFFVIMSMASKLHNEKRHNITRPCIELFRTSFERQYHWEKKQEKHRFIHIFHFLPEGVFIFVVKLLAIPLLKFIKYIKNALRWIDKKLIPCLLYFRKTIR